jgi:hypothetical protein
VYEYMCMSVCMYVPQTLTKSPLYTWDFFCPEVGNCFPGSPPMSIGVNVYVYALCVCVYEYKYMSMSICVCVYEYMCMSI